MATDPLALTLEEQERLIDAVHYVTCRFFPPLPVEYGPLAIIAVREYHENGPEAHVNLPADLNPMPRAARLDDDGDPFIWACELVDALRIWHMVDDDGDED